MRVKFFGQYLLERGVISQDALDRAAVLQKASNPAFGDVALSLGILTEEDAGRVYEAQLSSGLPFGDTGVQMGLLTSADVQRMLDHRKQHRLHIGEALVKIGAISAEEMKQFLDAFERERVRSVADREELPDEIPRRDLWKAAADLAYALFGRVVSVPVRAGSCEMVAKLAPNDLVVGMKLQAPGVDARFLLSVSRGIRAEIAKGVLRTADVVSESEEVLDDAVKEFLNLVCGGISEKAGEHGLELEISVPFVVEQTEDGVEIPEDWQGLRFPIHLPLEGERAEFAICV